MSKVGKKIIQVPSTVTVTVSGKSVVVKGSKAELTHRLPSGITATLENGVLTVARASDSKVHKALHGVTRAVLANLVKGVEQGFQKDLELVGTGYRARLAGTKLVLSLGLSHEVEFVPPAGITLTVEGTNLIHIQGADKHLVGQVAANIRAYRKPEPYKGKGIKYVGEVIRRKAGKAAKGAAA